MNQTIDQPAATPLRASLGPHLPFLRRYGRALVGSQNSGDALVRAALEALVQAPDRIDHGRDPRVELFRLFHAFWAPIAAQIDTPPNGTDDLVVGETLLAELPAHRREALLLTAVEGFSIAQTASILARSEIEVAADIASARAEISALMAGNVLIIEDEPIIAMDLQGIVEALGHTVIGIAATHAAAVTLAGRHDADLVLADIQLADGSSGVDAVRDILADHVVPVVFVTAFPERLLTGERPEPTFLITKPFAVDMLVATIGQALMMKRRTVRA
jgi:DNA-directed RNA polymerase specialized sigma24 family protein